LFLWRVGFRRKPVIFAPIAWDAGGVHPDRFIAAAGLFPQIAQAADPVKSGAFFGMLKGCLASNIYYFEERQLRQSWPVIRTVKQR
jgi:hypothetical protein